jgi:HD-GYP domain-containing protein (c-di-GMP phosphodiesterase class II)
MNPVTLVSPLQADWAAPSQVRAGRGLDRETVARIGARTLDRPSRRQAVRVLHWMVAAVEANDVASSGHSARVAERARELALAAGWSTGQADRLYEAGLVHDVGKLALSREVLGKPAGLTGDEYDHVKGHAELGARMVSELLDPEQVRWIREHHERWDGRGYPYGLRGGEISEGGTLLAMADSFDAMTSPRVYKPAMGIQEALADARSNAGRQFSPAAVHHLQAVLSQAAAAPRQASARCG